MNEQKSPFFAYRYLVVPTMEGQSSIYHELNKSKEELMVDIFQKINDNTKTEWIENYKRYLFYGFQKLDNLFIIKFAKESKESIFTEGEKDVEIKEVQETKYVCMIVDTEHQIILLERNSTIFSSTDNAIEVFGRYLRKMMREYDYAVNIYPLVSAKKFWSYVESADEIFELSLALNAPNMALFGNRDTSDILAIIKESTNNETFDMGFKNKEGNLKVDKNTFGNWIDYIQEVGGWYKLKFKRKGFTEIRTSDSDTKRIMLHRNRNKKYSDNELELLKLDLIDIHELKTRDKK